MGRVRGRALVAPVAEIIEEFAAQCCNWGHFARHRTYGARPFKPAKKELNFK